MPQVLVPIQEPPFQIYELLTTTQGVLMVEAQDAGGGGSGVPLVRAMFADIDTPTLLADQVGSAVAPFASVQAAADALPDNGGTVYISAGDYSAVALDLVGPAPNTKLTSLAGLDPTTPIAFLRLHADASCVLQDLIFTDTVSGDDGLLLNRTSVFGVLSAIGSLNLQGAKVGLGSPPSVAACLINGPIDAQGYIFSQGVSASTINADGCAFQGNLTLSGTLALFTNCSFSAGLVLEFLGSQGTATFDAYSYQRFMAAGCTIVNGAQAAPVVIGALNTALRTVSIAGIAAGVLEYHTFSLVNSRLEGLDVDDVIVVNPRVQLNPAGANGGGLVGWRMSALNTVELALVGTIAALANIPFLVTHVGRVP
jgi:hypothetical protein